MLSVQEPEKLQRVHVTFLTARDLGTITAALQDAWRKASDCGDIARADELNELLDRLAAQAGEGC